MVACANCGAITLNRGDLERLAGETPRAMAGGRTIVPDQLSSGDRSQLPPDMLTASEPPPPPRAASPKGRTGASPTLSPAADDFQIPREIEYFQSANGVAPPPPAPPPPSAVPAAFAPQTIETMLPDNFDDEDEGDEETQLFRGTMGLEDLLGGNADEPTVGPAAMTDEVPTAIADFAERPETETQESFLPGDRDIPATPALGSAYLDADEPFGGDAYVDTPDDEDDFVAQYQAARRRRTFITLGIGLMLMLAIGAPIAGFVGYKAISTMMAAGDTVADADPTVADADPSADGSGSEEAGSGEVVADGSAEAVADGSTDAVADADPPPADPPPTADPPPVKKKAPAVAASGGDGSASKPPPKAGGGGSARSLATKGWKIVDSDKAAAAALFEQALDLEPNNVDANYGYGYALLQMGDAGGARAPLCKARSGGDVGTQREVDGLLTGEGLSCD